MPMDPWDCPYAHGAEPKMEVRRTAERLVLTTVCCTYLVPNRFMLFTTRSGRIAGGTQDTLRLVGESNDLNDVVVRSGSLLLHAPTAQQAPGWRGRHWQAWWLRFACGAH
jgi:hypothetical protein